MNRITDINRARARARYRVRGRDRVETRDRAWEIFRLNTKILQSYYIT